MMEDSQTPATLAKPRLRCADREREDLFKTQSYHGGGGNAEEKEAEEKSYGQQIPTTRHQANV